MGLEALGLTPIFTRGDDWGARYSKIMKMLNHIRSLKTELNFIEIDHFLHIVSAEKEGKEAVEELVEGREESEVISKAIEQMSKDKESVEFVMEKYLEEFIETNFNKIKFDVNLELYQDEENIGRQYPTTIGNIDLLAVNHEKQEIVIIELKKGRTSDVVIGQILRYMGWVKENLAKKGYSVKGIIIAKDKDERLEYALKLIPNVNLYLYNISFELKKFL